MSLLSDTLRAELRELDKDRDVLALSAVHQVAALVVHLVGSLVIFTVDSSAVAPRLKM